MQWISSTLGQAFRKSVLIVSMSSLLALSSVFIFIQSPSYAAQVSSEGQKLTQLERMDKESENANQRKQNSPVTNQREENYEEQVKAAENPNKVYKENLKAERRANPGEGFVEKTVGKAEELVDKVTGKE